MTVARTSTLLSINSVSMQYGDNVVLRDVSIDIKDLVRPGIVTGQVVGLLGPSGSGKTTLLRIIAGLQKPTSGTVLIGSSQSPVRAGDVGVVSQSAFVYRNRNVLSNLTVAAQQAKDRPSKHLAIQRSVDILNEFGLLDKAHSYPCQLSGGQRQRVAIAQQMLAASDFILFDEPTAGLDPIAKDTVCGLIAKVASRSEIETLIIVSHDIRSVVTVCDTIWLMGRGKSGSSIVATYDLAERGLAWHAEVQRTPEFTETVNEIQDRFKFL